MLCHCTGPKKSLMISSKDWMRYKIGSTEFEKTLAEDGKMKSQTQNVIELITLMHSSTLRHHEHGIILTGLQYGGKGSTRNEQKANVGISGFSLAWL